MPQNLTLSSNPDCSSGLKMSFISNGSHQLELVLNGWEVNLDPSSLVSNSAVSDGETRAMPKLQCSPDKRQTK
ncbi:unnamed protein product [Protopolystoma xenopodis]|uniref:Uncharacterized protein n=1 Tax=Protopolystoma xenopodis TaxID=117903 RepID=A0A3S5CB19_9PLAT|nr:unnamed protein product [Protopolystoma xenopodis]